MIYFELISESGYKVDVVGKGLPKNPLFFIDGCFSERLFIEERIHRNFSTFRVCPHELYSFLKSDSLITSFFPTILVPEAISLILNSRTDQSLAPSFSSLPLGEKLLTAGAFDRNKLNFLLDSFQSSSDSVRFGEYLRRHLLLPIPFIDFIANPSINSSIFNNYRIGERLVYLGFISERDIEAILSEQMISNNPFAKIVAQNNYMLTDKLADFIASVQLDDSGEFIF